MTMHMGGDNGGEMNGSMMGPGGAMLADEGPTLGVTGASPADLTEFLEQVTRTGPIDTITIYADTIEGARKLRTLGVKAIDVNELAASISRIVAPYAQSRGRKMNFLLDAYAGAEHRGSLPFSREPQASLTHLPPTEPVNEVGVLAMVMNHQVKTMSIAHVYGDAMAGHMSKQLRAQQERIAKLEAERDQVALMMRNNILQSIDSEYLREQNRLKVHAQAQVIGIVLQSLPQIIQKFTANEVVEKFREFASTLKPEQQIGIAAVLDKGQTEALGKLFQTLKSPEIPGEVAKVLGQGEPTAVEKDDKAPAAG